MKVGLSSVQLFTLVSLSSFPQLNTLSRENKLLRRQLDEEMSMRKQMEQLLLPPPTSQHCSTHLPASSAAHPLPKTTSLPPFSLLPYPLSLNPVTGDTTPAKWSWAAEARWVPAFGRSSLHEGAVGRSLLLCKALGLRGHQMKSTENFDLSWPFDLHLFTRELPQYEVNVLQVKVNAQHLRAAPKASENCSNLK